LGLAVTSIRSFFKGSETWKKETKMKEVNATTFWGNKQPTQLFQLVHGLSNHVGEIRNMLVHSTTLHTAYQVLLQNKNLVNMI